MTPARELALKISEVIPVPELGRYEHAVMCRYFKPTPDALVYAHNQLLAAIEPIVQAAFDALTLADVLAAEVLHPERSIEDLRRLAEGYQRARA